MEIELKYSIRSDRIADDIFKDEYLKTIEEPNTRETIEMHGVYFDTEEHDLMKRDMAYRVRAEGNKVVAALKWNDKNEGALHTREEINVSVCDQAQLEKPNIVIFEESDMGKELINITMGKHLKKLMETHFTRRSFRVEKKDTILEISIDQGEIITENGTDSICELEIELFSGDEETLKSLGDKLAEKYDLVSEKRSKYLRGIKLLGVYA